MSNLTKYDKFTRELSDLLNRYGFDNDTNTPDYILAESMFKTLLMIIHLNTSRDARNQAEPAEYTNAGPADIHVPCNDIHPDLDVVHKDGHSTRRVS